MSPPEGPRRPTTEKPALTSALIVVIMAQVQKAELVWAARALGMNNRLSTRQPRASDTALARPASARHFQRAPLKSLPVWAKGYKGRADKRSAIRPPGRPNASAPRS